MDELLTFAHLTFSTFAREVGVKCSLLSYFRYNGARVGVADSDDALFDHSVNVRA